jgi:hypothetical protein
MAVSKAINRLPVILPHARTRGDCVEGTALTGSREARTNGQAQCLQVSCRHNLLCARSEDRPGRRHGGLAPEWTLRGETSASAPSCALDVADAGPKSMREIAEFTGLTKRRVEQVLKAAKEGKGGVELARLVGEFEELGAADEFNSWVADQERKNPAV